MFGVRQRQGDSCGRMRRLHRMRNEPGMQLNWVAAVENACHKLAGEYDRSPMTRHLGYFASVDRPYHRGQSDSDTG